jgi:hypothetical protein
MLCPRHALATLATLVALWPEFAGADVLAWRAPGGCPDASELRARIERRLDRALADVDVGIEVDVTRAAGRYVARVDLGAVTVASDVRTLTSPKCGELADAVAVIVARAAAERLGRRERTAPTTTSPAVPRASVAIRDTDDDPITVEKRSRPVVRPAPPPPVSPLRRWTLGARVSGLSGIGVIPQVGLGGELAVTVRHGDRLAELGAARWGASASQLHDGAPVRVDVDLDVAILRYGWRPRTMPLRGWLGAEAGGIRGADRKVPGDPLGSGRWLAAGAGFAIAWQMRPWARLVGGTEVMLALERMRFSLGDTVAYAPAPMSVRTFCGLEVGWQ